jgi:cell division protein FtsL
MSALGFLKRTLRGFRIIEVAALTLVLALALAVYLVKARAGRETGDITEVQAQIGDEQHRLRLLQAEVAHLEQPRRLEKLSEIIGLEPTSAKRETEVEHLPDLARQAALTAAASPKPTEAPADAQASAQAGALR